MTGYLGVFVCFLMGLHFTTHFCHISNIHTLIVLHCTNVPPTTHTHPHVRSCLFTFRLLLDFMLKSMFSWPDPKSICPTKLFAVFGICLGLFQRQVFISTCMGLTLSFSSSFWALYVCSPLTFLVGKDGILHSCSPRACLGSFCQSPKSLPPSFPPSPCAGKQGGAGVEGGREETVEGSPRSLSLVLPWQPGSLWNSHARASQRGAIVTPRQQQQHRSSYYLLPATLCPSAAAVPC